MKMKAMNVAFQLDSRRGLHYVHLNVYARMKDLISSLRDIRDKADAALRRRNLPLSSDHSPGAASPAATSSTSLDQRLPAWCDPATPSNHEPYIWITSADNRSYPDHTLIVFRSSNISGRTANRHFTIPPIRTEHLFALPKEGVAKKARRTAFSALALFQREATAQV